jgi:hypothetical protein
MTDENSTPEAPPARPLSVRIGLGSALFQGALVVLGVLLGFLITEWQADQSRKADADHALASIIEEIGANRDAIIAARDYHAEHINLIEQSVSTNKPLDVRSFPRGFIAPAQTANAAWTSASETGALSHLPFDKVLSLSRVYSQQAAYQQQQATVATVLYTNLFEGGAEGIVRQATGLRALISAFHHREQQLERAYSAALKGPDTADPAP